MSLLAAVIAAGCSVPLLGDEAVFEKVIRPLLVERCGECHGADRSRLRGGLVLTDVPSILRGGDTGPVVVPGRPEESSLYLAITYADPEFQMPPSGPLDAGEIESIRAWIEAGAPMPEVHDAGDLIVREGAGEPYDWAAAREHWAYRPVGELEAPAVSDPDWCRNEIDRFVLSGLDAAGLEPAPEADRRTLIRRAHFDLTGLPPTPEDVDAFLRDESPDAWARLVDRLLASPHYGERWARHWLDVARYADSNGLDENTAFGNAWRYRDWVVRSLNRDQPYDEFVLEQIAGDLLPESESRDKTVDRLIATGFLSLGPKVLAEPDKEKMQIDIVDEQLDIVGQAFLAQTIGCARCHDHKFDPITARDYYAMAGILYSTRTMQSLNTVARVLERDLAPSEEIERARLHAESSARNRAELERALADGGRRLQNEWSRHTSRAMVASLDFTTTPPVREAESFDAGNLNVNHENWGPGVGVVHTIRPDEIQGVDYRVRSARAGTHELRIRYASGEERPLEVLVDGEVVATNACAEPTGSFTPESMSWSTVRFEMPAGESTLRLQRSGAFPHVDRFVLVDPERKERFEAESLIIEEATGVPADLLRRWAFALAAEPIFQPWRALAELDPGRFELEVPEVVEALLELHGPEREPGRSGVGPRDRVFVRSVLEGPVPRDLVAFAERWQGMASLVLDSWERLRAGEDPPDRLPDEGQEACRVALVGARGVLAVGPSMSDLFPAEVGMIVDRLAEERRALDASTPEPIPRGIVVEDGDPVDLPVFIRGDHTNKAALDVPRGYLTVLADALPAPTIDESGSGRLQLARWIVDHANPLTSRVAVNRIWNGHFGRGIVATPSNFGTRGATPTHPELLDWLARRFMDDGWSVKEMHRLVMNSATYRMSGAGSRHAMEIDPENTLLWHHSPRRLEAEPIRDAILAVGGDLDLTMGGSLLRSGNFGYVTNDQSNSNERYDSSRRALYLPVIRNDMYPLFSTFDYTDSSVPIDSRANTVVAQQALFMLNSELVGSQSERLARRLLEEPGLTDAERIKIAYEICFSRPPRTEEVLRATAFLEQVRATGGSARSQPWPPAMEDPGMIDERLHAWRNLCQVLMASNEFIYIQ